MFIGYLFRKNSRDRYGRCSSRFNKQKESSIHPAGRGVRKGGLTSASFPPANVKYPQTRIARFVVASPLAFGCMLMKYLCPQNNQKEERIMAVLKSISNKQARRPSTHKGRLLSKKHLTSLSAPPPADKVEQTISPELQAEIDRAEEDYRKGKTLHFENVEEMNAWLEAL